MSGRGSAVLPTPPDGDTLTRHRGLHLIEDLYEGWGAQAQSAGGKVVWCELASKGARPLKRRSGRVAACTQRHTQR